MFIRGGSLLCRALLVQQQRLLDCVERHLDQSVIIVSHWDTCFVMGFGGALALGAVVAWAVDALWSSVEARVERRKTRLGSMDARGRLSCRERRRRVSWSSERQCC